jgi:hypothetical protein
MPLSGHVVLSRHALTAAHSLTHTFWVVRRNFYNKLGAQVQDGLITSRFAGNSLERVTKLPYL